MESVSGVTLLYPDFLYGLKRLSLLFDRFYVQDLSSIEYLGVEGSIKADVEFLRNKEVLVELPLDVWNEVGKQAHASKDYKVLIATFDNATVNAENVAWDHDYFTRLASARMGVKGIETVPICERPFPTELFGPKTQPKEDVMGDTLRIGLNALPEPDDACEWEAILDFRAELKDQAWEFRRFLRELGTRELTGGEVAEEIRYSLNQYSRWMKIHERKSRLTRIEAVLIPFKIIGKAVTFRLDEIPEVIISLKKNRVELLEAEMGAPGKECAYIFRARQEFAEQCESAKRSFTRPAHVWPI